ncbi:MAG TPA: SGNH/GDSL hydrolase family protein [Ktedonobacteraceae bacterium]|nr:SGNH/GDSL hydrolase family protein [Ktedonobacteraceae bacterium]
MLKGAHIYRRLVVSGTLIVLMFFAFVPATMAASSHNSQPQWSSGLKQHYLALGDSLAFGYQPNGDFTHGYVNDLFQKLYQAGVKDYLNLGCPGETSSTLIHGGICQYSQYKSQLKAAVAYLRANAGKVSPVTLDIGANDMLNQNNFNPMTCTVNQAGFWSSLATLDSNLTGTILPSLKKALTVKGRVTGEIVMMNYYDPLQNLCPNSVAYSKIINRHLAADVHGFGTIVNVFQAFGGAKTPNPNICSYTWMCTAYHDIHATNKGYRVIADTFAGEIL